MKSEIGSLTRKIRKLEANAIQDFKVLEKRAMKKLHEFEAKLAAAIKR